jgi:Cd2+/Zn2+-exporting ATPase/Cu+-exporting ATPase
MALQQIEIPVRGMDCAGCCSSVQRALKALPGVQQAEVLLAAEKAIVQFDAAQVDVPSLHRAVEGAGYTVPILPIGSETITSHADVVKLAETGSSFTRSVLFFTGFVAGIVLLVVVAGEWLGLFEAVTEHIPWTIGWLIVLIGWYPILLNVIRAAIRREVISHTLMSIGVVAALAVGQWTTAAIVVLFMRVGDYVEAFTAERARRAVRDLTELAPQTARLERDGIEQEVAIEAVTVGDTVLVRPGEQIPVDGIVVAGQATVDQATITGESIPVEVEAGSLVLAATIAQLGHLRIQVTRVGTDTTFGRVIKLVEEAESHRAGVQRLADRFSAYFFPVVAAIAILTFLLRRDPLATAAVLVVACSCSFALATPIAMLASIGASAKRGLLIKGGKYLEVLAKADVLLIDKTGTLTLGQPHITDVVALNGKTEAEILTLAAAAERHSEHPLAAAIREAGQMQGLPVPVPDYFVALPGFGVRAHVAGSTVAVGSHRLLSTPVEVPAVDALSQQGKSLLYVLENEMPIGVLAAADTVRREVPEAMHTIRQIGIRQIELLTGDHERTAATLAQQIGVKYRANLLPEDKVAIVKQYQSQGHIVAMVGDGVNDAPALAQADVGIAMGAAGTDIALEAAHIALMRDDWHLVPEAFAIARRTLRVVKINLAFTTLYNVLGLSLAAIGILPPIWAAVAQSIPDLGILANSSRLLHQRKLQ